MNPAPRTCPQCNMVMRVQGAYICGDLNDWIAYQCDHCSDREIYFPNRIDNLISPMPDIEYGQGLLGPAAEVRSPMKRNEVHLVNAPNGHVMSTDCWCEPVSIQWVTNKHGIRVLVIDHNDDTILHHTVVLAKRNELRGTPASGNMADVPINKTWEAPWITRVLNDVKETT